MTTFVLLLASFGILLAAFGVAFMLLGRSIVRCNGANQFTALAVVGLLLLGAFASPAFATGHGQQAFIVQEYIAAPQAVIVPHAVQQQQAACVVEQFQAYSAPLVQRQIVKQQVIVPQKVIQQRVVQKNVIQRQRAVRQRSISIQRSRVGGLF